ncbi:hypothetical protein GGX14DRAFT_562758 [Mycena pura]|uniref:Uncharacterized protein n=1 Tax=Mycena pura TaxID=153505 RepID=A0AAD6YJJ6_9AGAR|nr:hypothetical protein GGX14DRAFT_562758 [Mycena pura]
MPEANALPSVFAISELCAHIVDFLRGSDKDLRACALIAPAFTFPAQAVLFRRINLCTSSMKRQRENAAARLRKVLESAPHLRGFVRRVKAPMDAIVLSHLAKMHVPNMAHLVLTNSLMDDHPVGLLVLTAAQAALALPSIQTLEVHVRLQSDADLVFLFARCAPSVRVLDISEVRVGFPMPRAGRAPAPKAQPRTQPRAQLTGLLLRHCTQQVAQWLVSPQCPFDISRVQHLEFHTVSFPNEAPILAVVKVDGRLAGR